MFTKVNILLEIDNPKWYNKEVGNKTKYIKGVQKFGKGYQLADQRNTGGVWFISGKDGRNTGNEVISVSRTRTGEEGIIYCALDKTKAEI